MVRETSKKRILFQNFIGGLAWGFGSVVGASVVVAFLAWILTLLGVFPFVGNFFPQSYR